MSANQWFRMYSEFATDPKVQMMSEAYQRRFIMVLCLRCSNEHVTLHDEEVAFQLRISNEEWAETKACFIAKNLLTQDNTPTAWDKRQFRSDSSAERVAKHRANKKKDAGNACNVTVTPPEADTDTEADVNTPPSAGERDESFPMTLDWMPSQHFPTLAKQAMLPMPGSELFAASLAEFRAYWIGQSTRHRTQHEWDHALIKSLKSEKARGAFREVSSQSNARASPAKSSIHAEREAVSFGLTGRKPKPNELPNAASERDITAEAIRIA